MVTMSVASAARAASVAWIRLAASSAAIARALAAMAAAALQRKLPGGKSASTAPSPNSRRSSAGSPWTAALVAAIACGARSASSAAASRPFKARSTAFLRSGQKLSRSARKPSAAGPERTNSTAAQASARVAKDDLRPAKPALPGWPQNAVQASAWLEADAARVSYPGSTTSVMMRPKTRSGSARASPAAAVMSAAQRAVRANSFMA